MKQLCGKDVFLRALEPEDLEFLFALENDPGIWEISGTLTPYSRKVLRQYLEKAHRDIYGEKQLRLGICRQEDGARIGLIELFDVDPRHQRAGVGIVIAETDARNKGYGSQALELVCRYAFEVLQLHQLYAGVAADNAPSLRVFQKLGFEQTGVRRHWLRTANGYADEYFLQKFHPDVH